MNPLSWLPFYNEGKQEGENFDGSLLVPLTVGLVSVISSVLVGYRSGLLNRKQAASLIVKHVEEAERSVNSQSPREMTKRKSAPKTGVKLAVATNKPAVTFAPTPAEHVVPIVETGPSMQPQNKSVDYSKQRSVHPQSAKQNPAPVPVLEVHHHSTEPTIESPTITHKSTSSHAKRNKKSKQSNQSLPESEASITHSPDSSEQDVAWVVVTSKKLKQSGAAAAAAAAVLSGQPTTKSAKKKSKTNEGFTDITSLSSTQPRSSGGPQQPGDTPPLSVGEDKKQSVKVSLPAKEVPNSPKAVSKSSAVNTSTRHTPEQYPPQLTASPVVTNDRSTIRHSREATSQPVPHQSFTAPDATMGVVATTEAHLPNTRPSKSSTALPADLLTQHLSAQVDAKELECQLLRDEVIRLRKEVGTLKSGEFTKPHVPPPSTDAGTMTSFLEPPAAQPSNSTTSLVPPPTTSSVKHRPDSPDSVLLTTLQQEIARLAKEMKLSQQRNENMEARLAAANKQISVAKSESAKQLKAAHQELDVQTQRAQQSEDAQRQLRDELSEALQQLECTRRKAEQWERERIILVNERDQLARERDTLASTHQACLSELDSARQASEELRATVREAELRAQSLERDRSVVLGESHTRIAQLEAQLAARHEQEQTERSHLQTVESTVARLTADTEQLRNQLIEKQQELESWREKCVALNQNLSELTDQLQSSESGGKLVAETIQSVSDTKPVAAAALTLLEATTQTDPEPGAEFEPETIPASAGTKVSSVERMSELEVSQLNAVAISPAPAESDEATNDELKAQVANYKSALDMTESILSKLQSSVDEEEERWRKALDASRMECEVLEEKLTKVESSLSEVTQERDSLLKRIEELLSDSNSHLEHQSLDDDRSSVRSLTIARMLDTVRFDEATPKPELIRLLNKFRYLIQVEHEALKKEQSTSSRLQSQLNALERHTVRQSSISETAPNGPHPQSSPIMNSGAVQPVSSPPTEADASDQGDRKGKDTITNATNVLDPVAKSGTDHHPSPSQEAQDDCVSNVLSNGVHSNGSSMVS